jgi:hypothetical protein
MYCDEMYSRLEITPNVDALLKEKKIYITFAYIGMVRCYKHNQLIWSESAPCNKTKWGGIEYDTDYLISKTKEQIAQFLKLGYIG